MTSRRLRLVQAVVVVAGLVAAAATSAAHEGDRTLPVPPRGTATWSEMLRSEARTPHRLPRPRVVRRMPPPIVRDLLDLDGGPIDDVIVPPNPAPQGPVLASGFEALPDDNSSLPPDTMGAIGPSHVMTMLNTQVRIQDRSGGVLSTVSLTTFWTSGTGLTGDPFDPRLTYDALADRWIAVAAADGQLSTSAVWLAITTTSDPTGAWTFFEFEADARGKEWVDFPALGLNGTWIAITANMFRVTGLGNFVGAKMWVIDKATALTGGPLTVTIFGSGFDENQQVGSFGFALQPAITFGAEATLYIADSAGLTAGGIALLRLSAITGTGAAPIWSVIAGSSFSGSGLFFVANNFSPLQIGAEQLGVASTCSGGAGNGSPCLTSDDCTGGVCRRIDSGDMRIGSAPIFRNGRLWVTHSGGRPAGAVDRTSVLWYELDPTQMPGTGNPIVQSGVVEGAAGVHVYFPSIAVNSVDDVCIGFSRSDATTYVEAAATGRLGTDPAGATDAIVQLKAGEDAYFKTFGGDFNRWGDYSATVVDPVDDLSLWTLQQYAATDVGTGTNDDRWSTWWAQKTVSAPTTSTSTTTSSSSSTSNTSTSNSTSSSTSSSVTTTSTTSTTSSSTSTSSSSSSTSTSSTTSSSTSSSSSTSTSTSTSTTSSASSTTSSSTSSSVTTTSTTSTSSSTSTSTSSSSSSTSTSSTTSSSTTSSSTSSSSSTSTSTSTSTTSSASSTTSSSTSSSVTTTTTSTTSTSTSSSSSTSTSSSSSSSSSSTSSSVTTTTSTSTSTTSSSATVSTTSTTSTTLPSVCSPIPLAGCIALEKGTLRVQEKKAGREKLALGLKRFDAAVTRANFGNPVTGTTAYALCIYDDATTVAASLLIDRAGAVCGTKSCWEESGSRGYRYGDRGAIADGVKKLTLKGGDAGRGKILVKARNKDAKQQTALPTGVAAALAASSSATVQLVADDASCFGTTLSRVKRATATTFRAIER